MLWGINPRFHGLSPCIRKVAYALRTRAPLVSIPKDLLPLDLHVLSLPLAFILSQDQTLRCIKNLYFLCPDYLDEHPLDLFLSQKFKELIYSFWINFKNGLQRYKYFLNLKNPW